ncbi:E3 ubiquitin-protein ligase MARCHF3-like isoform X1 [Ornithodoros turicata]|uniref:E3 ubiquitin-protein ligase MARCHF3-like isoform X1 n=1 Tax=Ornithodoros turicata TaxID=34597 RepID=UPI00313872D6
MAANRRSRGGSALSCRLCFRGQEVDYLFLPCLCTGDAGLVHRGCIERALLQNGNESCATCGYRFKIKTKTKSMFLWLVSSDRRQEAVFFMLNTFGSIGDVLAFTLAWLKALSYLNSPLGPAVPALVAVGFLVVLSFFWALFVGYRFWYFTEPLRQWRRDTCRVQVLPASPVARQRHRFNDSAVATVYPASERNSYTLAVSAS